MKAVVPAKALTTAVKAARAAGKLMRANWHLPKRVKLADTHDIKLELDVRSQKLIEKILGKAFPQIPLLGEEGCSGPPSLGSDAASIMNAEYRWVVDPIDGTVNYFFGMPHAAVSIALQSKSDKWQVTGDKKDTQNRTRPHVTRHALASAKPGEAGSHVTLLGVIYDPFADELWTVIRGGPTRLNGKIVRVSNRSKLEDAVIAMGFSKSSENLKKSLPHLNRLARRALKIRIMGSAALELAYVASGRLDVYFERTINLWDVAAGALMVERSGGEFWAKPAPGGKFRMVASNGLLRRKLQIGSLLK
jgi:myo-inositol-1(or 4)-monophosphatase